VTRRPSVPSTDAATRFRVVAINAPHVPRLAVTKQEAAAALGVSVDFFDEHIVHELRIVRRGRRRLIPIRELERWLDQQADGIQTA
jgi:excisionase family DNA binding protein